VPIYEYLCDSCSYQFEVKQSIKDDALTTCERCGKALRRLISSPGIMFKGSGWYVTDYAGKKGGPSGKSESKSDGKSEGKSESSASADGGGSSEKSSSSDKAVSSGSSGSE